MAKSGYLIEFLNQAGTGIKKAKSLYWHILGTNLVKSPCTATFNSDVAPTGAFKLKIVKT